MLDQNTDRMSYVIGVVLLGGLKDASHISFITKDITESFTVEIRKVKGEFSNRRTSWIPVMD